MQETKCGECGQVLDVSTTKEPSRSPCPNCGSTRRTISIKVEDTIQAHDGIGYKVKDPNKTGKNKIRVEGFKRVEKSCKAPLVERVQHVDRANDKYHEKVTNLKTGEVIHECNESLKKHRGHGSAQKTT